MSPAQRKKNAAPGNPEGGSSGKHREHASNPPIRQAFEARASASKSGDTRRATRATRKGAA